ncbi:hypothetical protein DFJ73DRAFT_964451 [Zopfochytrium polystomum]|nr:hypothetical protein DFJ73DRAFT_964451 [Zopfochytrium polystomum]
MATTPSERKVDIEFITKLRIAISPFSDGKYDDNFNLEVAKDTHEVRLARKYPAPGWDFANKSIGEMPDALLHQLFLIPSHKLGEGVGGIQNVATGLWLEHDPKTGKLKAVEEFTGAPDQIFHCVRHFYVEDSGTLFMTPRPGPMFVGPEGEIGVLSFLLGTDGKPLGRPSGSGSGDGDGAVVYDIVALPDSEYNCDFEFFGYGGTHVNDAK